MASLSKGPSPQELLDTLDDLLKGCERPEVENAFGVNYTAGLNELKKVCSNDMEKIKKMLMEKVYQLVQSYASTSMDKPFTILSIGCGDGSNDVKLLQAIIDRFPEVSIHYIGTDINEQTCQKAGEVLGALKSQNVTIEILTVDFEKIDSFKSKIPPCDIILAVHVFYYMKDLKKALSDAQHFKKDKGGVLTVLSSSHCPDSVLHKRFFEHDHKWPMCFYENVAENLTQMGIAHEKEMIEGGLDLTEYFQDGFQKPHQKLFLEFVTLNKMSHYPEAVSRVCIDYLRSECLEEKSNRYVVPFTYHFIFY